MPASASHLLTPKENLKGKTLEQLILTDGSWSYQRKLYHLNRYGVQCSLVGPKGNQTTIAIPSLPDFEGTFPSQGRQFCFDAKVTSSSSWKMSSKSFTDRQLPHLLNRADMGGITGILLHFNPRKLKKKSVPPATFLVPVHRHHPIWGEFYSHQMRYLSRVYCEEYGVPVRWWKPSGCRKIRPHILEAVTSLDKELEKFRNTHSP